MSFLYINESFNLYVGNDDPDNTKKRKITNLQLPELEEMTASHHAGGVKFEMEVGGLGFKALVAKFKTTGWDPQAMAQLGIADRPQYPFTATSVVRDKATGIAFGVRAVMWGRLTKLSPSEMKRGDLYGHDHEIKEIMHYELYFNSIEKYFFDFAADVWRVQGSAQNQDELDFL